MYSTIKNTLDRLYTAGGVLGALFLIAILCLIVVQMLARWFGALNRGAHIRVSLLLSVMGRFRYYGELWCFAIGGAASTYLAWYAIKATRWSHKLNDISQGQDATPAY